MSECENCDCGADVCDLSGSLCPCDTEVFEENLGLRLRTNIANLEPDLDLSGNERVISLRRDEVLFEKKSQPTLEDNMVTMYLQGMLYLLRFFNWSATSLQAFWVTSMRVISAVKQSMNDNMYVFFEGSSYPYRVDQIQLDHPGTPPIEWYYNGTKKTFIGSRAYNSSQTYQTKHFPYLSAEIKYNDLTLYDASEFVNTVRWFGEEMPDARHLIAAWTLQSGIVLQTSKDMSLFVIDTEGSERKVPL